MARILKLDLTQAKYKHYNDLDAEHWANNYIQAVSRIDIFNGYRKIDD